MNPRQHVANVADGIVRVELYWARKAGGAAAGEGVKEDVEQGGRAGGAEESEDVAVGCREARVSDRRAGLAAKLHEGEEEDVLEQVFTTLQPPHRLPHRRRDFHHLLVEPPRLERAPFEDLLVPRIEVLRGIEHDVESVCSFVAFVGGEESERVSAEQQVPRDESENVPSLRALSRLSTQQRSAIHPNPLRLVYRIKQLPPHGHIPTRQCSELGIREGKAGQEEVQKGLLGGC